MALKKILDSLDGVPADVAKEYTEKDGKFHLDIDGDTSEAEIKRLTDKHRIAEEHRQRAENDRDKYRNDLDEMRRGNIPKADVDALEASWKIKNEEAQSKMNEKLSKREKQLNKVMVGDVAKRAAKKISLAPDLIADRIAARLAVEFVDDEPVTRVLDKDGKPSAMTIAELQQEFAENPAYAAVMIGSKGTGAGGNGGQQGNGAPKDKPFKDWTDAERVELYRKDPAKFKELSAGANR